MHKILEGVCLGTAGFGMEYGINNKTGKPSKDDIFKILEYAIIHGIRYIDTAQAYGNAEEMLGEFGINKYSTVKVITKLLPNCVPNDAGILEVQKIMEEKVRQSLAKLGITKLYGLLLHTSHYLYDNRVWSGLCHCRDMNLVEKIGASVYESEHAEDLALLAEKNLRNFNIVQIPYSFLDQRLHKTNFFDLAEDGGVEVFARSPFLQGLVFMHQDEVPNHLSKAKGYLHTFHQIIMKNKLTIAQTSLLFSYSNKQINHTVFGVDSITQIMEDIKIIEEYENNTAGAIHTAIEELKCEFQNTDKYVVMPSLWKKD